MLLSFFDVVNVPENRFSPCKNKLSLNYYHDFVQNTNMLEVSVNHKRDTIDGANSYVFIVGSQHYHKLFDAIQLFYYGKQVRSVNGKTYYPNLTVEKVNDIVEKIKKKDEQLRDLSTYLGETYTLPAKPFETVIFTNESPGSLALVNPAVIRRVTTIPNSGYRLSCCFRCGRIDTTDTTDSILKYEQKVSTQTKSCWPYTKTITTSTAITGESVHKIERLLTVFGVICLPLSSELVETYSRIWVEYLVRMMRFSNDVQITDVSELISAYRNKKKTDLYRTATQKQSVHIPAHNGNTRYGHYINENLELFQLVEDVVSIVFNLLYPELVSFSVHSASLILRFVDTT